MSQSRSRNRRKSRSRRKVYLFRGTIGRDNAIHNLSLHIVQDEEIKLNLAFTDLGAVEGAALSASHSPLIATFTLIAH